MALVAIEEQNLHDIGDALRSQYGETHKETINHDYHTVLKTDGATGFGDINTSLVDHSFDIRKTITCSGASSVVVKMSYYNDGTMWFSINSERMPDNTDESAVIEKTFSSNTVSFVIYVSSAYEAGNNFGLYAEIYGYDADGNLITYSTTVDVENTYKPREIAPAIEELRCVPEEAFTVTGDCSYRFAYNSWNWFIERCGDKITTKDISNAGSMFFDSNYLKDIPFEFSFVDKGCNVSNMFAYCTNLKSVPSIDFKQTSTYKSTKSVFQDCSYLTNIGTLKNLYPEDFSYFFKGCYRLRELPAFENVNFSRMRSYNYAGAGNIFSNCYSLRKIPTELLKELYVASTSASYQVYYNGFQYCYVLDDLIGLPVNEANTITSNMFYSTFNNCGRLKSIVFDTNDDGSVKTAKWKAQTIDLAGQNTNYTVGTVYAANWITGYNSGIIEDKCVRNDEDYQALKDDPDWFTYDYSYSRYNHDSAVETINSLPDTSAYLSSGGTNTIKFRGGAGSLTDGGAINTLTEAEIAVAAAKGWTVSLV